jgi:hypothetical protein
MSYRSESVKRWRQNTKDKMVEAMGGKCQCCGYDKHTAALAFHHIDPNQKDIGFSGARANPKAWSKIVAELRKCILVCHNCHSEIHAGVRSLPETYEVFNEALADFKKVSEFNDCPVCGDKKPIAQKFCSHRCAQKNSRKVDWDSIDLLDLLNNHGIGDLENILGVSNAAIYKQRNKILKNMPL